MIIVALVAFSVHAFYWVVLRRGFRQAGTAARGTSADPMSVIVAARNEAEALPRLLRALERQDHPHFEIIVVDDGSSDRTREILKSSAIDNLRIVSTDGDGKKAALTRGIQAAANELLAFTDADCTPPPQWLSSLAAQHAACEDQCVLIGYSPFIDTEPPADSHVRPPLPAELDSHASEPESSGDASSLSGATIVVRLAQYETFITGFLTAAAAGLGRPYMAVGRNISYPRTVFERVGGFEPIMHSLSGDDDLFVQEVARQGAATIRAVLDPRTYVPTPAPRSLREWAQQKRRHASAGRFYARAMQAHLTAFHGTNLIVWLAPLLVGWPGAALLAGKLALQIFVLSDAAAKLRETDLIPIQPLLEPLYLLYNVLLAPIGLMKMPQRW